MHSPAAELQREAGGIGIQRVDEAAAIASPQTLSTTWLEQGIGHLAEEQPLIWDADAEQASRTERSRSASLSLGRQAIGAMSAQLERVHETALDEYLRALQTLGPWIKREPKAKFRYLVTWAALALGDTCGVAGAALLLGEEPWIAIGQAIATGLAAVTSGAIGGDVKDIRLKVERSRDPESLTNDERRYTRVFSGVKATLPFIKTTAIVCTTIVLLVTVGILALRSTVEGTLAGLVFGALAAATALASFVNSYSYADEAADIVDNAWLEAERPRKLWLRLSGDAVVRNHDGDVATSRSIDAEHKLRGEAARTHLHAVKYQTLSNNPGVVGHGPASGSALPPNSTPRRIRAELDEQIGAR
ncbi:hypothetical protein GCM10012320_08330 [Sinomonas cellulolyticus]|nr:hypothetical protein GCM10012320_08330 [Sinomonas sp. KCTC 49339]